MQEKERGEKDPVRTGLSRATCSGMKGGPLMGRPQVEGGVEAACKQRAYRAYRLSMTTPMPATIWAPSYNDAVSRDTLHFNLECRVNVLCKVTFTYMGGAFRTVRG